MATFNGTIKEFHDYIGPRIRNVINNLTRKPRQQKNGVCELCGKKAELQSAHVHDRDRRTIIESALIPHTDGKGQITCSIENVELEILEAHEPIEETFKFICRQCHVEYDSSNTNNTSTSNRRSASAPQTPEFSKISRIKLWAKRPHQINSKIVSAYLRLSENGDVSYPSLKSMCIDEYSIERFDSHFASMKSDKGNSHGAVFYVDGEKVEIWGRVREEIDAYFRKT